MNAREPDGVSVSSGITRPFVVDWTTLPPKHVRAFRQDATVLTLGMSDGRRIVVDGRRVTVRKADGIHLTPAGADVAARLIRAELVRLGVLTVETGKLGPGRP